MRKPQTHHALYIGQWTQLNDALAQVLPQFDKKNFLRCYSNNRSVGKFENINFIFTEV